MMHSFNYKIPTCNCGSHGACSSCYQNAIYPHIDRSEIVYKESAVQPVTDIQNIVLNDIFNMAIKIKIPRLDIHRSFNAIHLEFLSPGQDTDFITQLAISILDDKLVIASPYRNTSNSYCYLKYEHFLFAAIESVNNIKYLQETKLF